MERAMGDTGYWAIMTRANIIYPDLPADLLFKYRLAVSGGNTGN